MKSIPPGHYTRIAASMAHVHNRQIRKKGIKASWMWFKPWGDEFQCKHHPPASDDFSVIGLPVHDREITPVRVQAHIEDFYKRAESMGKPQYTPEDAFRAGSVMFHLMGPNMCRYPFEGMVAWLTIDQNGHMEGCIDEPAEVPGTCKIPLTLMECVRWQELLTALNHRTPKP